MAYDQRKENIVQVENRKYWSTRTKKIGTFSSCKFTKKKVKKSFFWFLNFVSGKLKVMFFIHI